MFLFPKRKLPKIALNPVIIPSQNGSSVGFTQRQVLKNNLLLHIQKTRRAKPFGRNFCTNRQQVKLARKSHSRKKTWTPEHDPERPCIIFPSTPE